MPSRDGRRSRRGPSAPMHTDHPVRMHGPVRAPLALRDAGERDYIFYATAPNRGAARDGRAATRAPRARAGRSLIATVHPLPRALRASGLAIARRHHASRIAQRRVGRGRTRPRRARRSGEPASACSRPPRGAPAAPMPRGGLQRRAQLNRRAGSPPRSHPTRRYHQLPAFPGQFHGTAAPHSARRRPRRAAQPLSRAIPVRRTNAARRRDPAREFHARAAAGGARPCARPTRATSRVRVLILQRTLERDAVCERRPPRAAFRAPQRTALAGRCATSRIDILRRRDVRGLRSRPSATVGPASRRCSRRRGRSRTTLRSRARVPSTVSCGVRGAHGSSAAGCVS
jgi:hypothetical protein